MPALVSLVAACGAGGGGWGGPQKQAAGPGQGAYPGTPVAGDSGGYGDAGGAYAGGGYVAPPAATGQVTVVAPTPEPAPSERPGLGTVWGESVYAPVTTQPFQRASTDPWAIVALRYNDAEGVRAHADYLGAQVAPLEVYAGDGSLGISVVDASGAMLPGIATAGRAFVVGADGDRYRLVVRNGTGARFEVVTSVDGLDVIDGAPADPARRGYILDPYGVLVIDGFRQSDDQVAAFRFGAVDDSYAARTSGDRNVGVIGFAIFAEKGAVWTPAELQRRDTADPFPARSYAAPPPS
ncbi:MAG: hypothetical protein H6709_02715 [Kofleriaceae bacterium]|nr:hypothetical protein [Kofleriaceae bacterium]MCB9570979.1 hypothetical protein [Kofleriaceae bacterium]